MTIHRLGCEPRWLRAAVRPTMHGEDRDELAILGLVGVGAEDGPRLSPRTWSGLAAMVKAVTLLGDIFL